MATGHRPQLRPQLAKRGGGFDTGGLGSASVSTRSLPSYLTLKTRKPGQGGADDVESRDLKAELEERERQHFLRKEKEKVAADPMAVKSSLKLLTAGEVESEERQRQQRLAKYQDSDADADSGQEDSEDSSDDDDDDDEEEEAEMMRELEKIKKEREEERKRKEVEESEAAALEKREAAMKSNPVLNLSGERAAVKRRWDDDVVFRNQAKDEPAPKKRFVNDPLRSDFHRKFLRRYIK